MFVLPVEYPGRHSESKMNEARWSGRWASPRVCSFPSLKSAARARNTANSCLRRGIFFNICSNSDSW